MSNCTCNVRCCECIVVVHLVGAIHQQHLTGVRYDVATAGTVDALKSTLCVGIHAATKLDSINERAILAVQLVIDEQSVIVVGELDSIQLQVNGLCIFWCNLNAALRACTQMDSHGVIKQQACHDLQGSGRTACATRPWTELLTQRVATHSIGLGHVTCVPLHQQKHYKIKFACQR